MSKRLPTPLTGGPDRNLAIQIEDELDAIVWSLVTLIGPDVADLLDGRSQSAAERMAAQLWGDDEHVAAQTVIDLAAAGTIPDDPDPDWWASPLGRVTARSVGHDSAEAVTQYEAGARLGISQTRVAQLLREHKLDRHPDGGVDVASIRRRLIDRS